MYAVMHKFCATRAFSFQVAHPRDWSHNDRIEILGSIRYVGSGDLFLRGENHQMLKEICERPGAILVRLALFYQAAAGMK